MYVCMRACIYVLLICVCMCACVYILLAHLCVHVCAPGAALEGKEKWYEMMQALIEFWKIC